MTFPQHIAVTMATAVLRVATRVCAKDVEGRSEDKRWRERHKKGCMQKSEKSEKRRIYKRSVGRESSEERWSLVTTNRELDKETQGEACTQQLQPSHCILP